LPAKEACPLPQQACQYNQTGQYTQDGAERMVRTIKEATVKRDHYASIQALSRHVSNWLIAYNFAMQLKALKFRTP
jgi:hypothetical protein